MEFEDVSDDEDWSQPCPKPIIFNNYGETVQLWKDTIGRKPMDIKELLLCPRDISPADMQRRLLNGKYLQNTIAFDGEFYSAPHSLQWNQWNKNGYHYPKIFDIGLHFGLHGKPQWSGQFLRFGQFANIDGVVIIVDFFDKRLKSLAEIQFLLSDPSVKRIGWAWRSDASAIRRTLGQHFTVDDHDDVIIDGQAIFDKAYNRKDDMREWCRLYGAPGACICGLCTLPDDYLTTKPNLDDVVKMLFKHPKTKGWKPILQKWNRPTAKLEKEWNGYHGGAAGVYRAMGEDVIGHFDVGLKLMRDYGSLIKMKNCLHAMGNSSFRLSSTNLWDLLPVKLLNSARPVVTLAAERPPEKSKKLFVSKEINVRAVKISETGLFVTHCEPSTSKSAAKIENSASRAVVPVVEKVAEIASTSTKTSNKSVINEKRPALSWPVKEKRVFVDINHLPIVVVPQQQRDDGFMETIPCMARKVIKDTVRAARKAIGWAVVREGQPPRVRRPYQVIKSLQLAEQRVDQLGSTPGSRPFSRAEKAHIYEIIKKRINTNALKSRTAPNRVSSEKRRVESKRAEQIRNGRAPTYGTLRPTTQREPPVKPRVVENSNYRNSLKIRQENYKRRPYNELRNAVMQQGENKSLASSSTYSSQRSLAEEQNAWHRLEMGEY